MDLNELRHFELRELYYFVALAEELHFARAADRVGIHQSPLSKAITLMERHLGVRLFVRDRRSTQLTPIGEMLLNDARRILAEADQAHRGIVAAAAGRTGRLRIAIADGLAQPRVAALLRKTYREDSAISVHLMLGPLSEQLRLLRSGLLDVGLTTTAPDLHTMAALEGECPIAPVLIGIGEDIDAIAVWKDSLTVVFEREHPLATQTAIDWDALTSVQVIVVGERSMMCGGTVTLLDLNGRSRNLEHVPSVELLLTLAAAGKGIGLIGAALAKTIQRDDLALRPLSSRRPKITTFLLRRKEDQSPLVTRFLERVQKSI
jgi:DNA-binding transcriptional LysR family regulator